MNHSPVGLLTLYIDLHQLTLNELPAEKMVAKSRRANYRVMQMLKGVKVEVWERERVSLIGLIRLLFPLCVQVGIFYVQHNISRLSTVYMCECIILIKAAVTHVEQTVKNCHYWRQKCHIWYQRLPACQKGQFSLSGLTSDPSPQMHLLWPHSPIQR